MPKSPAADAASEPAPTPDEPTAGPAVLAALGELGGIATSDAIRAKSEKLGSKVTAAQATKALGELESRGDVWKRGDEWLLSSAYRKG